MRRPGPGRAALQPWYDLAEQDIIEGRTEEAVRIYHAILYYAPFEAEAREKLNLLLDIGD
jgi:hypothetical protein